MSNVEIFRNIENLRYIKFPIVPFLHYLRIWLEFCKVWGQKVSFFEHCIFGLISDYRQKVMPHNYGLRTFLWGSRFLWCFTLWCFTLGCITNMYPRMFRLEMCRHLTCCSLRSFNVIFTQLTPETVMCTTPELYSRYHIY